MAIKKSRTTIEVFSLSFLDIIACAFGAVVILILLAKQTDEGNADQLTLIEQRLHAQHQAKTQYEALSATLQQQMEQLKTRQAQLARQKAHTKTMASILHEQQDRTGKLTQISKQLTDDIQSQQTAATQQGQHQQRDPAVGGIPVDSHYVIFILDTSGSMKRIWPKVIDTMNEVLNNHPTVRGFQVMSDNGEYLLKATKGQWRRDSTQQRHLIINAMKNWHAASSSSPIEGISEALQRYRRYRSQLALYVLGDDYSGSSYDSALAQINQLNQAQPGKIARIHAIAFNSGRSTERFTTLMVAIAQHNNGSFITVSP